MKHFLILFLFMTTPTAFSQTPDRVKPLEELSSEQITDLMIERLKAPLFNADEIAELSRALVYINGAYVQQKIQENIEKFYSKVKFRIENYVLYQIRPDLKRTLSLEDIISDCHLKVWLKDVKLPAAKEVPAQKSSVVEGVVAHLIAQTKALNEAPDPKDGVEVDPLSPLASPATPVSDAQPKSSPVEKEAKKIPETLSAVPTTTSARQDAPASEQHLPYKPFTNGKILAVIDFTYQVNTEDEFLSYAKELEQGKLPGSRGVFKDSYQELVEEIESKAKDLLPPHKLVFLKKNISHRYQGRRGALGGLFWVHVQLVLVCLDSPNPTSWLEFEETIKAYSEGMAHSNEPWIESTIRSYELNNERSLENTPLSDVLEPHVVGLSDEITDNNLEKFWNHLNVIAAAPLHFTIYIELILFLDRLRQVKNVIPPFDLLRQRVRAMVDRYASYTDYDKYTYDWRGNLDMKSQLFATLTPAGFNTTSTETLFRVAEKNLSDELIAPLLQIMLFHPDPSSRHRAALILLTDPTASDYFADVIRYTLRGYHPVEDGSYSHTTLNKKQIRILFETQEDDTIQSKLFSQYFKNCDLTDPEDVDFLFLILTNEHEIGDVALKWALRSTSPSAFHEQIKQKELLGHWRVCTYLAKLYGKFGTPEDLARLNSLTVFPLASVRQEAAEAIQKILERAAGE
ncbi:MAG: hypothetical protein HY390_00950 [Deltaproteobacteria bacterium]|nr:hypothetical protein [Deltaproteobacteria bacterium]